MCVCFSLSLVAVAACRLLQHVLEVERIEEVLFGELARITDRQIVEKLQAEVGIVAGIVVRAGIGIISCNR